ncbi:hypothetical protein EDD21DRAFT_390997 [Dissophora ornata]|nr:hypothetical protein EDD21DRAFT_390997 [Dissophora ornata]
MQSFHQGLISPWLAGVSCVLFTVLFVGSLFVFPIRTTAEDSMPSTGSSPESSQRTHHRQAMDRDHPLVIQQRLKGITLTMILAPLYLWIVLSFSGTLPSDLPLGTRLRVFLQLLGLSIPNNLIKLLSHIFLPVLLVAILYMGPLLMMFLNNELPFQPRFQWSAHWHFLREWIGIRNYIAGPVAEEFIFRACMVAIAACSGGSMRGMVFGLPLVFGIAHLHHGYESYVKKGRTRQALIQAGLIALVQLAYTTLFGWFATYLFLRTSSVLGPCLSHSFCNMMGLPDVSSIQYYGHWKKWLYLAFLLGVVLFGVFLRPLTEPALYGDSERSAYWYLVAAV